ncbi:MAG: ATP-binding cassette domain-containing protein, partial [Deltaproteobacteria bacterium]|nr:ATP-binding cassette domain-containing protein [Deltaproteobacteria bacterium]
NILVGRHLHSRGGFVSCMLHLPFLRKEESRARETCREILEFLGLSGQADEEAVRLPYGQQRIVELGRALACDPRILLLDEPAAGLNIRETVKVGKLISRIREQNVTVLLVEHDMSLVMDISDDIVVLSYGQKIAEDKPASIQKDPEVIQVYLGEGDA